MSFKVGIPRGLFYYQYYPLWKSFFKELGVETVISDRTTKKILDDGVKSCVDEACLPVKLFHGHVLDLRDKVDYIFIPRFTSIYRNEYICPEFGGLPDMIRHTLTGLPQIIDTEVDLRKSEKNAFKAALDTGSYFTEDRCMIRGAYKKALEEYRQYRMRVKSGDALSEHSGLHEESKDETCSYNLGGDGLRIAVIGHTYNLYDSHINMGLLGKLRNRGIDIITPDMIDSSVINQNAACLKKRMFWSFGRKAVGGAFHILERGDVDGIIYLMSFGCGVDSFVCDLVERNIRRKSNMPFIILTLDEHSGEAGLDTRLEAFIDMLKWRKMDETYLPTHG